MQVESGNEPNVLVAELALGAVRAVEDELGRLVEVIPA
jgi:hypothetical protein